MKIAPLIGLVLVTTLSACNAATPAASPASPTPTVSTAPTAVPGSAAGPSASYSGPTVGAFIRTRVDDFAADIAAGRGCDRQPAAPSSPNGPGCADIVNPLGLLQVADGLAPSIGEPFVPNFNLGQNIRLETLPSDEALARSTYGAVIAVLDRFRLQTSACRSADTQVSAACSAAWAQTFASFATLKRATAYWSTAGATATAFPPI